MDEKTLKDIAGKKIRRQYFNIPLIVLCALMVAVPYCVFVSSLFLGKFDPSAWPSTIWTSVSTCFGLSLPFLILRILNKKFFGRIICVLTEKGIYYPKGMLRWETIKRIEYVIDAKPRCKSDPGGSIRAIIYTQGGRHVVLPNAPLCILSRSRKYHHELDIKIAGVTSLLPVTLLMAAMIAICPLYLALLYQAPGTSKKYVIVAVVVGITMKIFMNVVVDTYTIDYRFWCRVLQKKWLYYVIFWARILMIPITVLVLCYFPNWWAALLVSISICLGVPIGKRHIHSRRIKSYEELYEIYITRADFWERHIEKNKEKRLKKKQRHKHGAKARQA